MRPLSWFVLVCLVGVLPGRLAAQRPLGVGVEAQGYPAGVILTGQVDVRLSSRWALLASGGVNLTDRGDAGEHDNEDGDGGGGGIALRYHPGAGSAQRGWFYGVRADLWRLTIDWRDAGRRGQTKVTVLQPTGLVGYRLPSGRFLVDLSLALGAEINVRTTGEDVGDGAILLFGVALRTR